MTDTTRVSDAGRVREVTQADRDEAHEIMQRVRGYRVNLPNDGHWLIQRIAALRDRPTQGGVVDALCEVEQLLTPPGNVWTGEEPQWQIDAYTKVRALASLQAGEARKGGCANHPDRSVREHLDGDDLCQECCDAWARAEGVALLPALHPGQSVNVERRAD